MAVNFKDYSTEELKVLLKNLEIKKLENARNNFMDFVKMVWPEFVYGTGNPRVPGHHEIIAKKFESIKDGNLKRLIVNMPPRHTKSEFASFLFPAWMMGNFPKLKIIQTTHTAELAYRFGRKVRNLMNEDIFKKIFPDVELRADSQAAGRWETNHGGEYFAAGVGGAVTGRGADLFIIDDPHSEQDALSETAMENAYEWYTSGPRQRLQPGGSIVCVMTRWSTKDLTGKLIDAQKEPKSDQWEVVEFPALFDDNTPVWPTFWNVKDLEAVKASLSVQKWNAQWQQKPTSEEGAIIKREWWQRWTKKKEPIIDYIIQSYDTAFSKKETADYSAITTWGIFRPDEVTPNIILLDAKKGRWEFPELKEIAYDEWLYWEPEMVLIEQKASGMPLAQELRRMGIPVMAFTPGRGADKHTRVHTCAPVFASGMVWAPERQFAEEVIEEVAAFPYGDHDDLVDSMSQAIIRFRQGDFLRLESDWVEDTRVKKTYKYY